MKLSTDIKPRSNGTVSLLGLNGKAYVFSGDPLECDVDHDATVAHLLRLGSFFPASERDEQEALELLGQKDGGDASGNPIEGGEGAQGGELDKDGDERADLNALPLEANTPPQDIPGKGSGKKAAASRKSTGS
jgi:hypothetical protein